MILLYCIITWLIGIGHYKDLEILDTTDKTLVIFFFFVFIPILIGQNLK